MGNIKNGKNKKFSKIFFMLLIFRLLFLHVSKKVFQK